MKWSDFEIDYVKPLLFFNVSNENDLNEVFCWNITQPLLREDHQQKRIKYNFLNHQLRFIKAFPFLKLNEEGPNQDPHQ